MPKLGCYGFHRFSWRTDGLWHCDECGATKSTYGSAAKIDEREDKPAEGAKKASRTRGSGREQKARPAAGARKHAVDNLRVPAHPGIVADRAAAVKIKTLLNDALRAVDRQCFGGGVDGGLVDKLKEIKTLLFGEE